jgi:DNA uptake protein ComE-like DNA-binding protein
VGGRFQSKDQLKKCYAISEEKFVEIQSFILLPEHSSDRKDSGFYTQYSKKELLVSSKFNPDSFVALDWQKMGFSEKQASAIDKYKQYLGGSFVSKEKFKDCFIISEENYKKLSPFLLLPEKTPASFSQKYPKKEDTKKNYSLAPFDPNSLDAAGWEAIGFSEKQAQVIVNYRERNLRGQFRNLDDIKSCFVISEEKFKELLPFLHLKVSQEIPVAEHKKYEVTVEKPTDFSKIDLNKISYKQLIEYGFSEKDAAMLLSFRKKLGGFVHKQQVIDTYEIDKNLAEKLSQETQLNADVVAKYTLTEAPEEWLKTHPYFKFSAEKIIYFRISNPDDRKILKFLKLKPEYETKMKWYLKSE